jgi:hypothetical protein
MAARGGQAGWSGDGRVSLASVAPVLGGYENPGPVIQLLQRLAPEQGGALWIGLLVTLLVAFDYRRPFSPRNFGLALLLLPAVPLIDIMQWGYHTYKGDRESEKLLGIAFDVLMAVTGVVVLWGLALAFRPGRTSFAFNIPAPALRTLVVVLLLLSAIVTLSRAGEDAGPYTSLGARRWLETGILPYGDPKLRGTNTEGPEVKTPGHGAAATYGPLLFVAHIPFHYLTGAAWNPPDATPMDQSYRRPPDVATRLTCLAFHLVLVAALYAILRGLGGSATALGGLALYLAHPCVLGLGSRAIDGLGPNPCYICGLAFISHVAPTALTVTALACHRRPFVAGLCLAAGAGLLFFPAFFFPAFLGWYFWRRQGAARFLGGFALGGALIVALVVAFTPELDGKGPIKLFLESTLEHQEGTGPSAYGRSYFSFWHPYDGWKATLQRPVFGSGSTFKPTFLGFIALCGLSFFLARGRTVAQLAGILAMLAAAIQIWKTHAGGTYVEWYLPFLLVAWIGARPAAPAPPAPSTPSA